LPIVKKWSDLDLDFIAHPNTGELSVKENADAIVRSIRYLLSTNYYERLMHPEIGCNLSKQLFDPMSYATSLRIKDSILQTISNFEPRVKVSILGVNPMFDDNAYSVFLKFFIVNQEVERQTTFMLERTR
tara:strand:- start:7319 stop:7708 length:390 start_codon:yes stop_codon:yes gene_type:complete